MIQIPVGSRRASSRTQRGAPMSSVRTQRLHDLVDVALNNTMSSLGGAPEFARCFAVAGDKREVLAARYEDAMAGFRANVKVRGRCALRPRAPRARDGSRRDDRLARSPLRGTRARALLRPRCERRWRRRASATTSSGSTRSSHSSRSSRTADDGRRHARPRRARQQRACPRAPAPLTRPVRPVPPLND
jgi:hypothetical protein